jgi:class 3 adenylate cyclase
MVSTDKRIEFRVGIHMGDIVVEDGDIFGDGVNIAARLEGRSTCCTSLFARHNQRVSQLAKFT